MKKQLRIIQIILLSAMTVFTGLLHGQVRILTIGDSTMADYDVEKRTGENEMRGWGQMLPLFLTNGAKSVNAAKNGRSSKSFYYEFWLELRNTLKPGDYVFIQFGHNDEKNGGLDSDPTDTKGRGTAAWGQYCEYLKRYVDESRERGAIPVLLTPIVRCLTDENDNTKLSGTGLHSLREIAGNDSTMNYPMAMRALARQLNVPLVDMTLLTEKLVLDYGAEKSREIIYAKNDNTHLKAKGGILYARLTVQDLLGKGILKDYLTVPSEELLFSTKLFESERIQKQKQRADKIQSLKNTGAQKMAVRYNSLFEISNTASSFLSATCYTEGLEFIYPGISKLSIEGGNWPDGDIDINSNRYFELCLKPEQRGLYIDSVSIDLQSLGGDGMYFTALGSTDPSFAKSETFVVMERLPQEVPVSFNIPSFIEVAEEKTFYLRIYPWYNRGARDKYISISSISVEGWLTGN